MGITKERLEHELKAAEEQIERVKADANVAIGHALGKRDLLKMQLAFLQDQEKAQPNSAQDDVIDAHPALRKAQAVAEAAVS